MRKPNSFILEGDIVSEADTHEDTGETVITVRSDDLKINIITKETKMAELINKLPLKAGVRIVGRLALSHGEIYINPEHIERKVSR